MTHDETEVPPFVIRAWEKPSAGWLKVTVQDTTLGMSDDFYWCEFDDVGNRYTSHRTWAWRQWSMAGKPSVVMRGSKPDVLTGLIRAHPVLGLLADSFGIPEVSADDT